MVNLLAGKKLLESCTLVHFTGREEILKKPYSYGHVKYSFQINGNEEVSIQSNL